MGNIRSLLKLKPFIKKYRLLFVSGVIIMILSSIFSTPIPILMGYILDNISTSFGKYNVLYCYVAIIALLYVLQYICSITSKYIFCKINNLVVNELRYTVLSKVVDMPMNYLSNTEKGYIEGRINECNSVGNIFSSSVINIFITIVSAVLAMVSMFIINFRLSILVFILAPAFYFLSKFSGHNLMKSTQKMLEFNAILNGESFEIINGIEHIKILNGKGTQLSKFKNKLDSFVKSSLKQSKSVLLFTENIMAANNIGTLLIFFISVILIIKKQFTIGLYTSFSLYSGRVFGCSQSLALVETTIKQSCLSIERLYQLLDMPDENNGRGELLNEKVNTITFKNVSFKYQGNSKNVLDSLNFCIKSGEKVVIKGENGSGKTTVIKLLLGLYEPLDGTILYNDINLDVLNRESLREKIGIVSQDIFLFKGTVLDNILYGQSEKNREDVEKLIVKLRLNEYIEKLPSGLDTKIVQNNEGVSGGQAQVIAFIRAILLNKDLLIFDEPISNVDQETRDLIINILREIQFDGILIVVSHIMEGINFINKIIQLK